MPSEQSDALIGLAHGYRGAMGYPRSYVGWLAGCNGRETGCRWRTRWRSTVHRQRGRRRLPRPSRTVASAASAASVP